MTPALRTRAAVAAFAACAAVLPARRARAQESGGARWEMSVGPAWTGSITAGSRGALETTAAGGTYRLFATTADLEPAPGVELRVGARLTSRVVAQVAAAYARPVLQTTVSNDVEAIAPATVTDRLHHIEIRGGVDVALAAPRPGRRVMPFASASAGYLRELYSRQTLVQTGQVYEAGGGVKWLLSSRGARIKAIGLRLEARASVRRRGVVFDDGARATPVVGAALFFRF